MVTIGIGIKLNNVNFQLIVKPIAESLSQQASKHLLQQFAGSNNIIGRILSDLTDRKDGLILFMPIEFS